MNWLKMYDAVYLPSHSAEEFKERLIEMSELAEDRPKTDQERDYRDQLILLKAYELIDYLVEHAIDGIPKDMQRKIEGADDSMLCVMPGGRAYERRGSLSRNQFNGKGIAL